jgi:hypothetical protein
MGVRRLFSRGRQKFSKRGQESTFCLKKQRKRYYFSQKSLKTYYFCSARGARALHASPADAHVLQIEKIYIFWSQFSTCEKIYFLHTCSLQISGVQQLQKNDQNVDIGATKQLSNNLTLTFLLGKKPQILNLMLSHFSKDL